MLSTPDSVPFVVVSADTQSGIFSLQDINHLPYPGVSMIEFTTGGSFTTSTTASSDSDGLVRFNAKSGELLKVIWLVRTPSGFFANTTFIAAGGPFSFTAPVNAASGSPDFSPGS